MKFIFKQFFLALGWASIVVSAWLAALGAAGFGLHGYSAAFFISGLMALLALMCFGCAKSMQDLIDIDDKT